VRNRDFSARRLIELIDTADRRSRVALEVMFLDCRTEVLVRRYSETRRRHPLPRPKPRWTGILREATCWRRSACAPIS
jgi:RNase adapter protein RapZ